MLFSSQTLFMLYHKIGQVRFESLRMRSTQSPRFVIDLNFQNFFVLFDLIDSTISVIPRSLSRSRFSISVQPIWTFRSHRFAVTEHSYASRCHRVVPLGHTDRVRLYIPTGKTSEIFSELFRPRLARSASKVSGSSSSSPVASCRWSPPPSTEFFSDVAAVASSSPS